MPPMKRKRQEPQQELSSCLTTCTHPPADWKTLAEDALIAICSFCDLIDILSLRCSCSVFRSSSQHELKQRGTLSFSSLVGNFPHEPTQTQTQTQGRIDYNDNTISYWLKKDKQDECANRILTEVLDLEGGSRNFRCHRIDFCNMRNISSLALAPQHLNTLVTLDLSFCSRLEPNMLMNVITDRTTTSATSSTYTPPAPPLEELYLNGCRKIKGVHVSRLVRFFTEIKVLHLSGCSQTVDDACVEHICSLRNLQSLDLMGFNRITDRCSIAIFTKLNHLQLLNVDNCERLRWNFLLPFLQGLESWLDDASADEIISVCSTASNGDASKVRSSILASDSMDHWDLFSFRLQVANVSFGPSTRGGLLPYGLSALAITSLGCLREVNVSGARIVDDDVKVLVISCKDSLKSLEMRCCDNIGDASLHHISQFGENLVNLDISACINITDAGMTGLYLCRRLSSLKASSLMHVTDRSISSLGSLKRLVVLDLHNCSKVTKRSIERLLRELPLLVEVDARNISPSRNTIHADDKRSLSIFNGKRCNTGDAGSMNLFHRCSVRQCSQRTTVQQGARPRRMYHCRQCALLPKFNRGMCKACAVHCHKAHTGVYVGAVTIFYCDCAFGFQPKDCGLLKTYIP